METQIQESREERVNPWGLTNGCQQLIYNMIFYLFIKILLEVNRNCKCRNNFVNKLYSNYSIFNLEKT